MGNQSYSDYLTDLQKAAKERNAKQEAAAQKSGKPREDSYEAVVASVKQSLAPKVTVDNTFLQQLQADAQSFFDSGVKSIKDVAYSAGRRLYDDNASTIDDIRSRSNAAMSYLLENRESLGEDNYRSARSILKSIQDGLDTYERSYKGVQKHYSQWDTEDAYNTAVKRSQWEDKYKGKSAEELTAMVESVTDSEEKEWLKGYSDSIDYQERMGFDLDAGKAEVNELAAEYAQAQGYQRQYDYYMSNPALVFTDQVGFQKAQDGVIAVRQKYGSLQKMEEELQKKRNYLASAGQTQQQAKDAEAHEAWLQTLRPSEEIRPELDEAKKRVEELKPFRYTGGDALNQRLKEKLEEAEKTLAQLEKEYHYSQLQEYNALMENSDFRELSQYASTEQERSIADKLAGLHGADLDYEFINRGRLLQQEQTDEDRKLAAAMQGRGKQQNLQMTDEEVGIYNYLYATQGKEKAQEYLDVLNRDLTARERQANEAEVRAKAEEHPIAMSALSIALSPLKAAGYVAQGLDYLGDGKIDENAAYNTFSHTGTAIRDAVSQKIEQSGKWGQAGSFAYQTAMSMGDFLLNATFAGGSQALSLAIMGSGAAADTVISSKDRGLDDRQAFTLGTIAGIAEAATEIFSLDALLDADLMRNGIAQYVIKNVLSEGSEEVASSIINLLADVAIAGDKSEFRQSIQNYQMQGYSEGEAFGRAAADQAASMGMDFLGGALSGGIMGGAAGAGYYASRSAAGRDMERRTIQNPQVVQNVLDVGMNAPTGSVANEVAAQLQGKLDQGKKLSAYDKGRLYESNPAAVSENVFGQGRVRLASPLTQGVDNKSEQWQQAQRLSAIIGKNIVFFNGGEAVNGYYEPSTGEIFVNIDGADTVLQTVSHELTHSVEMADAYKDLNKFVMRQLNARGEDIVQLRKDKQELYARNGVKLDTQEQIDAEIVAQYVQEYLLTDEASIYQVAMESPTLGRKILNWIDGILAKMGNGKAAERKLMNDARSMYAKALDQSRGAQAEKVTAKRTAATDTRKAETANNESAPQDLQEMKRYFTDQYNAGEITEEEYNSMMDAIEQEEMLEGGDREERLYSIADIKSNTKDYGKGVILDTNIFQGVRPANWGKKLTGFVYNNLAGKEISAIDDHGNEEVIQFVKTNERVSKKDSSSRKAIDELARYRGDNIKALATVHAVELLQTAGHLGTTSENEHKWLDHNGWDLRKTYVVDRNGKIYEAVLNIANARDGRRILYAINNIRHIDDIKKAPPAAQLSSPAKGGTRTTSGNASKKKITKTNGKVKRQFSISDKTERDAKYKSAVINGDMEQAEKLAEEAAKEAGYDSPRLYHGTNAFGFTEFDPEKSDDRISIFTTSNSQVAETYSGETGRHRISDKAKITPEELESASPEKLLELLRDNISKDYRLVSDAEKETIIKENRAPLLQAARSVENLYVINMDMFDEEKKKALFAVSGALRDMAKEDDYGRFMDKKMAYDDALWDLRWLDDSLADEVISAAGRKESMAFRELTKWLGATMFHADSDYARRNSTPWMNSTEAVNELFPRLFKGVYELYGRTGNAFEIDAGGENWNQLDGRKIGGYGPVKTRDVAKYAKENGYDSVVFRNIRDNGDYTYSGTSDVYVFFGSDSLKSADPVTYDDEGNIIPLSERFNRKKKDIRYSISDKADTMPETEAETAESQTLEITRDTLPSKARDYLRRAESRLINSIGDALSIPRYVRYNVLKDIAQELSDEYLRTGTVSNDKISEFFDKAYAEGVVEDAEFYDQYKHIKDHLRTTGVTISAQDQSDIADYADFRRRAQGSLRILKEGGLPVDVAYDELRGMAPELFPAQITHPADQLVRMYDVAKSIQVSQKSLDEFYGPERETFRKWARNDFQSAVSDAMRDLKQVRQYAEEKAKKQEAVKKILTTEEAEQTYQELKQARRNVERVQAKNLLSESDEMLLGRMLKGEIGEQQLDPDNDNVQGIMAVYRAKLEYEAINELLREYKRSVRAKRLQKADEFLETANSWKDKKSGFLYARETMRRNILDIVPDRQLAESIVEYYFESIHKAEAASTKFKTEFRDRVRGLNLNTKVNKGDVVSEAHAVQLLGEAMDNIRLMEKSRGRMKQRDGMSYDDWVGVVQNLWAENPNLDRKKVEGAVESFRKIYDELFQRMNTVRVENGYEPVNYRQGYFPHFQPGNGDGIMAYFGKILGIDTQVDALPTTINGLTHTFKPGIQWFGNAQERIGYNTAYDAVEGFDKYIEGVASVIFQTENIQNLRALATQARYRTSDKGIQKQVDEVRKDDRLTDEEKQSKINEIFEHGKFALSNFVVELDEYTNLLANKKSRYDRTMEALMGRKAYTLMKTWENQIGANMIAGNISSALTNFIPLTQAGAQLDSGMILKGVWSTLQAIKADDGLVGMSDFLTNRRGSDPLVKTWVQKASGIMGTPMELIDNFTSEAIVRAAYMQNLKRGMSEAEALHQADIFAANVMADRSKGSMPTLFESRNPLFKAFTQFQLEVNNQVSEVFKDLPRNFRGAAPGEKKKELAVLAGILLKYFLGAMLYNELYEKLVGRRPAMDPLGILMNTAETWKEEGIGEAGKQLIEETAQSVPFIGGLLGGGRLPVNGAIPDLGALWEAATTEDWGPEKRWKEIQDELNKLAYVIPPFGGAQVSKIWKGIEALIKGGSYSVNNEGKEILQYPVYKDDPYTLLGNALRMSVLGKNSLETAQDWAKSGYQSLTDEETAIYKDMLDSGVKDRTSFEMINALRNIDAPVGTAENEKAAIRRNLKKDFILQSDVSKEGKAILYYGMAASETERKWMDSLADAGADQADSLGFVHDLYEAENLKGVDKKIRRAEIFAAAPLTEEEKQFAVQFIMDTKRTTDSGNLTQYGKFLAAMESGLSVDKYMDIYSSEASIDDFFKMHDAGVSTDSAADITIKLGQLEPLEGEENVSWNQECDVILQSTLSNADQVAALQAVSYESTGIKIRIGYENGLAPGALVYLKRILPEFDENGNGSYSQKEVTAAIDAVCGDDNVLYALTGTTPHGFNLTNDQKAVLWQLQCNGKKNPYNQTVGDRIYQQWKSASAKDDEKETASSRQGIDLASMLTGPK